MVPSNDLIGVSLSVPPFELTLHASEIHLWYGFAESFKAYRDHLESILSPSEHARAMRFASRQDRDRFVTAHGLLRTILGQYCGADPAKLKFRKGVRGKPHLAGNSSRKGIEFSLSYSRQLILVAIACDFRVGVDTEYIDKDFDLDPVAERVFSTRALTRFRALSPNERTKAFFQQWTKAEAFVKANGTGLLISFNAIGLGEYDEDHVTLKGQNAPRSGWTVCKLGVGTDYAAALAFEGQACALKYWQATPEYLISSSGQDPLVIK